MVRPAVFATIVGLAAGALAVDGAGERRSRAPTYALGIGGSSYIAWTAVGYATNLSLDAIALAVAAIVLLPRRTRTSPVLGGTMLGAGLLTHWMFATAFAAVLVAYTGVLTLGRRPPVGPDPETGERETHEPDHRHPDRGSQGDPARPGLIDQQRPAAPGEPSRSSRRPAPSSAERSEEISAGGSTGGRRSGSRTCLASPEPGTDHFTASPSVPTTNQTPPTPWPFVSPAAWSPAKR